MLENHPPLHPQSTVTRKRSMPNVGAIPHASPIGFSTNTHPLLLLDYYYLRSFMLSSAVEKVFTTYVCEDP